MCSPTIGRIVVALYSTEDISRDVDLVRGCFLEFQSYNPEPSWQLVIEMSHVEPDKVNLKGPTDSTAITGRAQNPPPSAFTPDQTSGSFAPSNMKIKREDSQSSTASTSTSSTLLFHSHHSRVKGGLESCNDNGGCKKEDVGEQEIASLLGEHMPVDPTLCPGNFVSLRLLLLRSSSRHSPEEADMVSTIKKSYRGYIDTNRWSRADVAMLLVRDWVYLSGSSSSETGVGWNLSLSKPDPTVQPSQYVVPTLGGTGLTHVKYTVTEVEDTKAVGLGGKMQDNLKAGGQQQLLLRSNSQVSQVSQRSNGSFSVVGDRFQPLQSRPHNFEKFASTSKSTISDYGSETFPQNKAVSNDTSTRPDTSQTRIPKTKSVSADPMSRYNTNATLVPDN